MAYGHHNPHRERERVMGIGTASRDAFGDPDRSAWARALSKVAHWAIPAGLVYVPVGIVSHVWPGLIPIWATTAIAVAFLPVWIAMLGHQTFGRICVACMREVPRDAARWAQRLRGFFWYDHHPILGFVLILGVFIAVWAVPAGWPSVLQYAVFTVMLVGVWSHHRLRPWCPYCRGWDEHGPRERVPNPDPTGVKNS